MTASAPVGKKPKLEFFILSKFGTHLHYESFSRLAPVRTFNMLSLICARAMIDFMRSGRSLTSATNTLQL